MAAPKGLSSGRRVRDEETLQGPLMRIEFKCTRGGCGSRCELQFVFDAPESLVVAARPRKPKAFARASIQRKTQSDYGKRSCLVLQVCNYLHALNIEMCALQRGQITPCRCE